MRCKQCIIETQEVDKANTCLNLRLSSSNTRDAARVRVSGAVRGAVTTSKRARRQGKPPRRSLGQRQAPAPRQHHRATSPTTDTVLHPSTHRRRDPACSHSRCLRICPAPPVQLQATFARPRCTAAAHLARYTSLVTPPSPPIAHPPTATRNPPPRTHHRNHGRDKKLRLPGESAPPQRRAEPPPPALHSAAQPSPC